MPNLKQANPRRIPVDCKGATQFRAAVATEEHAPNPEGLKVTSGG